MVTSAGYWNCAVLMLPSPIRIKIGILERLSIGVGKMINYILDALGFLGLLAFLGIVATILFDLLDNDRDY